MVIGRGTGEGPPSVPGRCLRLSEDLKWGDNAHAVPTARARPSPQYRISRRIVVRARPAARARAVRRFGFRRETRGRARPDITYIDQTELRDIICTSNTIRACTPDITINKGYTRASRDCRLVNRVAKDEPPDRKR